MKLQTPHPLGLKSSWISLKTISRECWALRVFLHLYEFKHLKTLNVRLYQQVSHVVPIKSEFISHLWFECVI